jgi:hypothetical protein
MANKSYIGKGVVYVENDANQLVDVGNATAFSYSADEEKKELKNFRTAGGGNYNSLTRVTAVNINLTISDFSADNLSLGLFGGVTAEAAGAVVGESQTTPADVSVDFLLPTDHMIDTTIAVTVTGFVQDTDYVATPAGIIILAAGSIAASTALSIGYTKKATNIVQAFINAAQNRRIVVDGLNEAQNGDPVLINIHQCKFGPAAETQFIGDEFGEIALTGEALPDTTIVGAGLSQYLEIKAA